MLKMDMSPKEIERFLTLVSEQSALYNPKDMSFRDHLLRDTIWVTIGQEMNMSSKACKKCWRNLKDSYTRFKRRYKETGQIDRRTNYNTYKLMSFLEDVEETSYRKKRATATSDVGPKAKLFSSDNPVVFGVEHIVFNKPIQLFRPAINKNKRVTKVVKANPTTNKTNDSKLVEVKKVLTPDMPDLERLKRIKVIPVPHNVTLKRRRLNESSVDQISVSSVVSANNCNYNDASHEETDEDKTLMYFATHVREVLKKLPLLLQIQAKQELFRILTKYELIALENSKVCSQIKCADTLKAQKKEERGSKSMDENVKGELNIYDDVIQIKEEDVEMITPKYD